MPVIVLADLGAVGAALMAVALLMGLYLLAKLIGALLGNVPVVGGWLSGAAWAVMDAARSAAGAAFHGALWAWDRTVWAAQTWAWSMIGNIRGAFGEIADTIHLITSKGIPDLFRWANGFINYVLVKAINYTHSIYVWANTFIHYAWAQANAYTHSIYNWANAFIHYAIATAEAYTYSIYNWANNFIHYAIATTLAYAYKVFQWADWAVRTEEARAHAEALSLFHTAEVDINNAERAAIATAKQLADAARIGAINAVDHAASLGLAAPWAGIITDLEQLQGIIARDWPDIRDAVGDIPRVIPKDLAGVIGMVGALAIPMLRYLEDCGLPNCRNLGGFGNILHQLLSAAQDAAIVAWMIYCIDNPEAAAADTAAVGGPLAAGTLGALESLFGVHA